MIRHYFKIALRNIARQKALAFINIAGLTIGLACFILFMLFAVNEFSYDKFHKNAPDIYRMYTSWDFRGKEPRKGSEPASTTPLGPAMKQDFPEVENFVRLKGSSTHFVRVDDKSHRVKVSFADPQLLTVFSFPLLHGNASTALNEAHNVILTKEKAVHLFGEVNPLGRSIEIKTGGQYQSFLITGVAEDIPVNSSIQFDILGSFDHILATNEGRASMNDWNMTIGIEVFVKLRSGSNLSHDAKRLGAFREKYYAEEKDLFIKEGIWNGKDPFPMFLGLQPLIGMHSNFKIDQGAVNPKNIWILIAISGGILLIACINFTTLAIGRSARRAREVGVRKVIGGRRKQLIGQFLGESFVLSFLSAALGLLLAYILLPFFNQLAGRSLRLSFGSYPQMIWLLVGLVFLVALLSGSYPAIVLSRFRPVEALKNKIRLSGSNFFTKSLVTFQFVLSISLMIATVIILQQLSYMSSKNLGFAKENVVVVNAEGIDGQQPYQKFRDQLRSNPLLLGIAGSTIGLGAQEGQMGGRYEFNGKAEGVIEYPVDPGYLNVMGMRLLAGRNFDPSIPADTVSSIIVNESLVRNFLHLNPHEAIGIQIKKGREAETRTIIGVTADFHFESLTRGVRSQLFLQPANFKPSRFFVRIQSGDPSKALNNLESAWKQVAPELPFNYNFVDEKFARFYENERRWSTIVGWAGGISIFLACLGLFGLVALAAINRTKEIGVRKVMGASAGSIIGLLSKDFVKLILIALVISTPLTWYLMSGWLENYAYRITIAWWVFLGTGIAALCVALGTISVQGMKAALMNPVKSLRNE
jgi:putative ABC transport system permease protein